MKDRAEHPFERANKGVQSVRMSLWAERLVLSETHFEQGKTEEWRIETEKRQ
jgi:hypothetical protein